MPSRAAAIVRAVFCCDWSRTIKVASMGSVFVLQADYSFGDEQG